MKRLIFIPLLLFSCKVDQGLLVGVWQAAAYYESNITVDTPLDSVRITFSPSGDYIFQSIGMYEERGHYRLAGNYLFLQDTTIQHSKERVLKVLYLATDSLKIGMESEGKSSAVFFGKVK